MANREPWYKIFTCKPLINQNLMGLGGWLIRVGGICNLIFD